MVSHAHVGYTSLDKDMLRICLNQYKFNVDISIQLH